MDGCGVGVGAALCLLCTLQSTLESTSLERYRKAGWCRHTVRLFDVLPRIRSTEYVIHILLVIQFYFHTYLPHVQGPSVLLLWLRRFAAERLNQDWGRGGARTCARDGARKVLDASFTVNFS